MPQNRESQNWDHHPFFWVETSTYLKRPAELYGHSIRYQKLSDMCSLEQKIVPSPCVNGHVLKPQKQKLDPRFFF